MNEMNEVEKQYLRESLNLSIDNLTEEINKLGYFLESQFFKDEFTSQFARLEKMKLKLKVLTHMELQLYK